jgi:hypothetical protein
MVWVIKIPDVDDVIMDDPNVFLKRDADKGSGEHIAPIFCGNDKVDMRSESLMFPKWTHCASRRWEISYQNVNVREAIVKRLD